MNQKSNNLIWFSENLAKTTSDAVKHYKGGWRKKDQKNGAKDVWEERPENSGTWFMDCKCKLY